MSRPDVAAGPRGRHAVYFFVSYARSGPPSPDQDFAGARDALVKDFFEDLRVSVGRKSRFRTADAPLGFLDQFIPLGADPQAALTAALGRAEVFVPLYSPSYVNQSWTEREQRAFRQRLQGQGGDPEKHIAPVLWTPFPSWRTPDEVVRSVAEFGDGIPEYRENGVRALCMLRLDGTAYRTVLERLADRIVDVAENHTVGPALAPAPGELAGRTDDPAFVVTVFAPAGGSRGKAGDRGLGWRPFGERQRVPVADLTAGTAERLDLRTRTVEFDDLRFWSTKRPGLAIVDAGVLDAPRGRELLTEAFAGLPRWVLPLVVCGLDAGKDADRARLAATVVQLLRSADPERPAAASACSLQDLIDGMARAVLRARRAYLRFGPISPPSVTPSAARQILGGQSPPAPSGQDPDTDD